jgi:hypothetical protein
VNTYDRALELAAKVAAEGVPAVVDPRGATPPCVLVTPPNLRNDLSCGVTAEWLLVALVPGPGNADAWNALDGLVAAVAAVVDWARTDFVQYSLSPDNPPFPAYQIRFEEAI